MRSVKRLLTVLALMARPIPAHGTPPAGSSNIPEEFATPLCVHARNDKLLEGRGIRRGLCYEILVAEFIESILFCEGQVITGGQCIQQSGV